VNAALGVLWFQRPAAEMPAYTATALAIALASTLATALLLAAVVSIAPRLGGGITPMWTAAAAITAGANVMLQCRLVLWQSQHRALASAALQLLTSIVNVALSLLAVLAFAWGGDGRNAGILGGALFGATVAVASLALAGALRWAPTREQVATLARYGLPLIAHAGAGMLLATADRWFVAWRQGDTALGIYGAGAQLGMVMAILADAFVKAWAPWLYGRLQADSAEDRRVVVGAMLVVVPAFLLAGAIIGALLHAASSWLLGPRYAAASTVLPWFMAGGAVSGIYMCASALLSYRARTDLLAGASVTAALLGALFTWMLVGHFGLQGAAAGYALAQLLLALIAATLAIRISPLPWRAPLAALRAWGNAVLGAARPPAPTLEPGNTTR
jgi:O-antigen/teichoic acid export membrane protein